MAYDPERHRRRSIRAKGHDYAGGGTYFLTLCTEGRADMFGRVVRGAMEMNTCGEIVWEEWLRSARIRAGIKLVAGVVMPNHLHGIIVLEGDGVNPIPAPASDGPGALDEPDTRLRRPARSLGSFVAMFKATTTRRVNDVLETPGTRLWQRNYHEHIVRSDAAMARIVNYVLTNPLRWDLDGDNPARRADDDFDHWLWIADRATGRPRP